MNAKKKRPRKRLSLDPDAFFDKLNKAYASLRRDPKAWEAFKAEAAEWDVTLMDGLRPASNQERKGAE